MGQRTRTNYDFYTLWPEKLFERRAHYYSPAQILVMLLRRDGKELKEIQAIMGIEKSTLWYHRLHTLRKHLDLLNDTDYLPTLDEWREPDWASDSTD